MPATIAAKAKIQAKIKAVATFSILGDLARNVGGDRQPRKQRSAGMAALRRSAQCPKVGLFERPVVVHAKGTDSDSTQLPI